MERASSHFSYYSKFELGLNPSWHTYVSKVRGIRQQKPPTCSKSVKDRAFHVIRLCRPEWPRYRMPLRRDTWKAFRSQAANDPGTHLLLIRQAGLP